MKKRKLNLKGRLFQKRLKRLFKTLILAGLVLILVSLLFNTLVKLPINSSKPVDAILVLGGSIQREMYAATLASQSPDLPIIISQGSKEPCIWQIFQRQLAPNKKVWLEKCANSTFENFVFSVPLLHRWGVHKVKVITSGTHLPRAKWLAQIHLGAQGMAVEIEIVKEWGVPGNRESTLKTQLDVARSLIWAVLSQIVHPPCFNLIPLNEVNLSAWEQEGFVCEHQGGV
ncbi:YdcF family protein [Aphanothece sacrum]|uniref:YdcF family protein n=1 Tax=Aphanothece sacrum TaxID=1122 RepID=UPI000F61568C|nr:YdcF family protein [Aphanothece sacrum]GBF86176.1 hypothetical protein AsFPU3_3247 [Aphanothece sacrum FPU3]